jgi:hypothetical protein
MVVFASAGSTLGEMPVFQVGERQYLLSELCGLTEAHMKEQFLEDVKGLSDTELQQFLPVPMLLQLPDAPPLPTDRKSLEDAAFIGTRDRILYQAALYLTLAYVADRLVKECGIEVDQHFDTVALEEAHKRTHEYVEFLRAHLDDPRENSAELHAEAVRRFRCTLPPTAWEPMQSLERRMRPAARWAGELGKRSTSPRMGSYGIKAMLTHYLLKDACEKGIYRERAERYYALERSVVQVIELQGFKGKGELLQALASDLVDDSGRVKPRGEATARDFVRAFPRSLTLTISSGAGSQFCEEWEMPPIGEFYAIGLERCRLLAWVEVPPAVAASQQPEGASVTVKRRAFQMAMAPWLPEVKSFRESFGPDVKAYAIAAEQPGVRFGVGNVEIGAFEKKPVPGAIFREMEAERVQMAAIVVEGAHIAASGDEKAKADLVRRIDDRIDQSKTDAVRNSYRAIKSRLVNGQ